MYPYVVFFVTESENETATDEIRDYSADFNNRPSNVISFMSVVPITSDRLHCELVRILFFADSSGNRPFYYFRSSTCTIKPALPLPSREALLPAEI